jgi:15-cis-phytoene desaturase
MPHSVAIFGGGVAGLSAAQELVERGFQVSVIERNDIFGGKARSLSVPNTGTGGRRDLPGEHGFRFFPGFYRHLPDTMSRIPFGKGAVADNLIAATRILVARAGMPSIELPARSPQAPADWAVALQTLFTGIGVPDPEVLFFVDRLLVLMTSCPERRLAEFEQIAWWNFIGASQRSKAFQTLLAQGLTRSLVAMRAEEGSTRTVGYILLQLLYGILSAGGFDRLLSGPTNEVWLAPWVAYLQRMGVNFVSGAAVTAIEASAAGVTGVVAQRNGQPQTVTADYYVCAMPVEIMSALVTNPLKQLAPSLGGLSNLKVRWMNGIQFYLAADVPLDPGHTLYADSPWALTSISQKQFWRDAPLANYGDGAVGGILSVDISEWEVPGILAGKPAMQCTANEVKEEVWAELKAHLNVGGAQVIEDQNLLSWFLDPDIQFPNPSAATNLEPLLINTAGSLQYRPDASTELPNLFLASDYVRTYTDIACMESANEAARRAVNAILQKSGSSAKPADVWPMKEPPFFAPMIEFDRMRFKLGLPHSVGPV